MKLSLVFGLVLVSFVSALPRYPAPRSPPTQHRTVNTESTWYNGLVHLATVALGFTFSAGQQPGLSSQQALHVACALGLSFNPNTKLCELPGQFVPDASHPEGHGKCPTGRFWFGPRQSCISENETEDIIEPPTGSYCPLDWGFSARYSCCVPHSSVALARNRCDNGNGTWSLIRLACVERQTPELR